MLQFILGRSGCGKTQRLYEEIRIVLNEQPTAPLYLIVPEQASFETEKQLLQQFGAVDSQRVQVLSFTRMATTVFRNVGGIVGKRMDKTASLLLMHQALSSVEDHLTLFRRYAQSGDGAHELLKILTECKRNALTPDDLFQAASQLPHDVLRSKTEELSLIFSAYDAMAEQSAWIDPQDDLTVLAKRLAECPLFDGAHLFVDGFDGFTGQEMTVLERLLTRAAKVTVSLCTDGIFDKDDSPLNRFFAVNRTYHRLQLIALSNRIPIGTPILLEQNYHCKNDILRAVQDGCFATDSLQFDETCDAVSLVSCKSPHHECRYVAQTVRRLLRENGGFARDFTVVTRDMATYGALLETAFKREDIPCYTDHRQAVISQPLITLVESALTVLENRWNTTDLLRLCKTGLIGFSPLSTAHLENYAFLWNLRKSDWLSPFEKHPNGLGADVTEDSKQKLAYLNILRHRLVEPLVRFSHRLGGSHNGQEFASAVYRLLTEWRVPRLIRLQTARLRAQGEIQAANEAGRIWDWLMDLLNTFASVLNTAVASTRFIDLFHAAVSGADLGVIPQTLDGVHIGSADRMRYTNPKTVILVGVNEGAFPRTPSDNPLLTDKERRRLIDVGLPLSSDPDLQTAEERYYAYTAMAAASERLIVTYANQHSGNNASPSSLISSILRVLPNQPTETPDPLAVESPIDAFALLTTTYREPSKIEPSLKHVLSEHEFYRVPTAALYERSSTYTLSDPRLATALFGEHLRLYPTQVETFYRCRFAYFCQYGIRIKPRKKAELNAAEAGQLTHYIMQTILPTYVAEQFSDCTKERIEKDTRDGVAEYVKQHFQDISAADGRFANLIDQLSVLASSLLWRVVEELRSSQFVPVDYELPIGRLDENDDGIAPWILETPDGHTIQVRGTVDRVDVFQHNDKAYVRIIDYKTGEKQFDLSEVLQGINLQMLIYLFSICQNGQTRYGDTVPSGVLYLPAKLPVVRVQRDITPEELNKKQLATMRMNGLLIDDPTVLEAMETDLAGLFIPAKKTAKGLAVTSSVASLEQFGKLQNRIAGLLTEMVNALKHGQISPLPVSGTKDGCEYCEFRDICRHESGDPTRVLVHSDLKKALEDLDGDPVAETTPEQEEGGDSDGNGNPMDS